MTVKSDSMKGSYKCMFTQVRNIGCVPSEQTGTLMKATFDAYQRTRSGGPVPNYRSRISRGIDASGAYTVDVTRLTYGEGECYTEWKRPFCVGKRDSDRAYGVLPSGYTFSPFASTASLESTARNTAFGAFWSRAAEMESYGLTFLGELRQTISMLRHPFKGSLDLLKDYFSGIRRSSRRIRRMSPRTREKYLSSAYLELVFGWKPLIADVHETLDAIIRLENEVEFRKISGYGNASAGKSDPTILVPLLNSMRYYTHSVTKQEVKVKCRGAYRLSRFSNAPVASVAQNLGFLPSGFVPTIWELIPWSFAIDYFTNVGDILAAASVCRGNIAWSNTSQVIEESTTLSFSSAQSSPLHNAPDGFQTFWSGDHVKQKYRFTRTAGVAVPDFQVSLPGFSQAVNLSVLFAQWRSVSRSF